MANEATSAAAGMSPFGRAALRSTLAGIALAILGNIPLMGLPGALLTIPATPIIVLLYGTAPEAMFPHDSAWPFFILLTLLAGPCVPAAWLAARALGLAGWRRWAAFVAGFVALGTVGAIALYAFVPRP
jgi:hypothetical protein